MTLSNFTEALAIQIPPTQQWSIVGPEAETFAARMPQTSYCPFYPDIVSQLDGLLLAEALSIATEPQAWLEQVIKLMRRNSTLLVIEWRYDGPPNFGPDLDARFKKGRLCRLLRESGFGLVETLEQHPAYYVIKAVKGPPPPTPHANEFVDVAGLDELPKNAMKKVDVFGHNIVIANTGKEIVAFAQTCPHANGHFDKGLLRGRNVICPLHAYIWNVNTGEPVEPADEDVLRRYPVQIDSEQKRILVALAPPA